MKVLSSYFRNALCLCLLAWLLVFSAAADTFFLSSGIQVHGIIERREQMHLVIRTGDRTVRIPKASIVRIEENDKDGSFDREAAKRAAEERERQLHEATGLTREQREHIRELVTQLNDGDPVIRGNAQRALAETADDLLVFRYLEHMLPTRLPVYLPPLLQILAEAHPDQARPALRMHATHAEQHTRAAAVELLGITRDKESLGLMMRGLLDHAPVVRMAACAAVYVMGAREATPLLINNLDHADLRVHNYAREALTLLWEGAWSEEPPRDADDWYAFWTEHQSDFPRTVDIESLKPLVPVGTRFDYC